MIGSARPNSLNELKESLSYAAKRPVARVRAAESRVIKTSRVARVVVRFRIRMGGAKFVLMSFVHAARKPETGSFIRTGHMTVRHDLFKAQFARCFAK